MAAAVTASAAGDEAPSDHERRQQLDAQRAAAEARYESTVRECERRFVVTSCIDQAKAERRTALERIAQQQMALDDAERKRRAELRRQRIEHKQARQASRATPSASEPQPRVPRAAPASSPQPARRFEPRSAEEEAAQRAEAARRAQQSQQRRERAQAHEEAVRKRNAERAAQRPPAAPLPVPGASAASPLR